MLAHSMMSAFVTSLFFRQNSFPIAFVISFGKTWEKLVKCLWSHDEMEVLYIVTCIRVEWIIKKKTK